MKLIKKEARIYVLGALSALLLLCLFDMPYGFYELVRILAFVGFCYLAYLAYKRKDEGRMIVYIILAILFQPFLKVALGRVLWNIIDILVAFLLIYSIIQILCKKGKK